MKHRNNSCFFKEKRRWGRTKDEMKKELKKKVEVIKEGKNERRRKAMFGLCTLHLQLRNPRKQPRLIPVSNGLQCSSQ